MSIAIRDFAYDSESDSLTLTLDLSQVGTPPSRVLAFFEAVAADFEDEEDVAGATGESSDDEGDEE